MARIDTTSFTEALLGGMRLGMSSAARGIERSREDEERERVRKKNEDLMQSIILAGERTGAFEPSTPGVIVPPGADELPSYTPPSAGGTATQAGFDQQSIEALPPELALALVQGQIESNDLQREAVLDAQDRRSKADALRYTGEMFGSSPEVQAAASLMDSFEPKTAVSFAKQLFGDGNSKPELTAEKVFGQMKELVDLRSSLIDQGVPEDDGKIEAIDYHMMRYSSELELLETAKKGTGAQSFQERAEGAGRLPPKLSGKDFSDINVGTDVVDKAGNTPHIVMMAAIADVYRAVSAGVPFDIAINNTINGNVGGKYPGFGKNQMYASARGVLQQIGVMNSDIEKRLTAERKKFSLENTVPTPLGITTMQTRAIVDSFDKKVANATHAAWALNNMWLQDVESATSDIDPRAVGLGAKEEPDNVYSRSIYELASHYADQFAHINGQDTEIIYATLLNSYHAAIKEKLDQRKEMVEALTGELDKGNGQDEDAVEGNDLVDALMKNSTVR